MIKYTSEILKNNINKKKIKQYKNTKIKIYNTFSKTLIKKNIKNKNKINNNKAKDKKINKVFIFVNINKEKLINLFSKNIKNKNKKRKSKT